MSNELQHAVSMERRDGVTILRLSGRVDGTNAGGLAESSAEHIDAGEAALLLDLGGLTYISSAGLRVLLLAARKMQARSGKALFCGLSEQIAQVFEVSGFNNVLSVYGSQDEALATL